ncbi:hypothetical protein [Anaerosalibacter massiliensis]|uniref:hypothetical protein n=1 Tax=Anaerosalibacter massiliensis TaxID=1347392 RepID=UPI00164E6350|nr:hypothetical protein [Anaerosalibacter massiliensis]
MNETRKHMYYLLEKMRELDSQIIAGENAKKDLKLLEEQFYELCGEAIEEDENARSLEN